MDPILRYYSVDELLAQGASLRNDWLPITEWNCAEARRIKREIDWRYENSVPPSWSLRP